MAVIILIGYMGSGKTTFGRKIAKQLKYDFIDADDAIESACNLKIPEIFSQFGESYFRELESQLIERLKDHRNVVFSTGGGMPCFGQNMQRLNELGITIYLKRPVSELVHRLMNAKKPRPLIAGKSEVELYQFIEKTLIEREVFYNQAQLIFNRDQQNLLYLNTKLMPLLNDQ